MEIIVVGLCPVVMLGTVVGMAVVQLIRILENQNCRTSSKSHLQNCYKQSEKKG